MRITLRWIAMLVLVVTVLGSFAIPGRVSLALRLIGPVLAVLILWWTYRGEKSEDND